VTPTLATKTWKPHKKQELFSSLPDSIFEAMYGGAAGGGKSDELVMLPVTRGFHQSPYFKGIIFRRTYPELESEIILRSKDWYPHFGGTYNEERRRWTFGSGSIMQFGHCEHENDIRKYDTSEYQYCAFDELTSFTEFQYKYFVGSRLRSKQSSNLPVIARSGTNPGNIGHKWVRKYFVEPAPWGTIIRDSRSSLKRIFIQCLVRDNPHIDINYINRLMMLPEAERRAKLDGDWYTFEGQVFSDFRENPIPGEPENALHVVEPFDIPSWWIRLLAVDWGKRAYTCGLWGALSPNDRLYIYREYAQKNKRVVEWASEIGQMSQGESLRRVVLCRSAWQDRGEDEYIIADKFKRYSGLEAAPAKNDRIQGKLTLEEYIRWTQKPPSTIQRTDFNPDEAARIMRQMGIQAYQDYVKSFEPEEPETNLPKLQVLKGRAPVFVETIPLCIYGKNNNIGKPSEDVQEFEGDDPYDTGRYLVMEADDLIGEMRSLGEEHSRVGKAVETLEKSGDMTSYYRAMEAIERKNKDKNPSPVRKYHRGIAR
jgi:hypothetical protein